MIPDIQNTNMQQLYGLIQTMLAPLIGYLVAKGIDSPTAGLIVGGLAMVICAVWSVVTNRTTSQAERVAAVPGVKVVVDRDAPAIMHEIDHPNVVSSK